ncbi:MAG: hypothetical protein B7Z73_18270, partial [Planctomycetia bacterium 21-64-5]
MSLAAILALAALLRCNHLADLSFWFDESFCWKMTTFKLGEVWQRVALDNHPPLYFYLLWFWARVFGDSPGATRSLSVVLGLVTVAGAYLLARQVGARGTPQRAFPTEAEPRPDPPVVHGMPQVGGTPRRAFPTEIDQRRNCPHPGPLPEGEGETPELSRVPLQAAGERAGLLAAALVALSPFQIDWSQQVRMYVLGACLTLLSCWLLLRALASARPRWQDFAWYTLAATALAYTHYFGLFVLAGQFLYAVGAAL